MSKTKNIAIIVGSLSKNSVNRKVANALVSVSPDTLSFEFVEIGNLPLYNNDLDSNPPAEWVTFKEKIAAADGYLFVTPEHNRSIPAALKNAIDIASRPYGQNAWGGKPGAVITVSPGATGGFGANHHLRQPLVFLDIHVLAQPEAYVGGAYGLFDDGDNLVNESTKGFFTKYMAAFADFASKF